MGVNHGGHRERISRELGLGDANANCPQWLRHVSKLLAPDCLHCNQ